MSNAVHAFSSKFYVHFILLILEANDKRRVNEKKLNVCGNLLG
jgi:hypothetical protein